MNKQHVARELVRLARTLTAGTWSLPGSDNDVKKIAQYVEKMKGGEFPIENKTVEQAFYPLLGDDSLFDDFYDAQKKYLKECVKVIAKAVKEKAKQDASDFKDPNAHKLLVKLSKML